MSEVTTYTCDRCGAKSEKGGFLEDIQIITRRYSRTPHSKMLRSQEWCEKCLIETGVRNPDCDKSVEPPTEDAQPSFEELVREIAEDVVRENCGG